MALKGPGGVGYFGVTVKEAGRLTWYETQKALLEMNFAMTDVRDRNDINPNLTWP